MTIPAIAPPLNDEPDLEATAAGVDVAAAAVFDVLDGKATVDSEDEDSELDDAEPASPSAVRLA